MIGITGELLRKEITRLGGVVAQTTILHPSGTKLHSEGDPLTLAHAKILYELTMGQLYLLEPGESERGAVLSLTLQKVSRDLLQSGDVLAQELRGPSDELLGPQGANVDELLLEKIHRLDVPSVSILRRTLKAESEPAAEYLKRSGALLDQAPRFDPQLARILRSSPSAIRPLLVVRARVLVAFENESDRSLFTRMIETAGHETQDSRSLAAGLQKAVHFKPDVILAHPAELRSLGVEARASSQLRTVMFLTPVEQEGAGAVQSSLEQGANETIGMPPRRDLLLEKISGLLALRERKVALNPLVVTERRKGPREPGHFACQLRDSMLTKSLPVSSGEVLDAGEGGLALEYNRPEWPCPWAYRPHTVHPKHPFYNYSKANPLGRPLEITLPAARGKPLEGSAWVVNVMPSGEYERARLWLEKASSSVSRHSATARGQL